MNIKTNWLDLGENFCLKILRQKGPEMAQNNFSKFYKKCVHETFLFFGVKMQQH